MRELTSHKVNGLNDVLKIEVLDEPGQGNACHEYRVVSEGGVSEGVLTENGLSEGSFGVSCYVSFQNGPLDEYGDNGISNEALLAIVEDRLKGFQSGEYSCRENEIALTKIQEAMHWLHHRTRERMSRGVEGTNEV